MSVMGIQHRTSDFEGIHAIRKLYIVIASAALFVLLV